MAVARTHHTKDYTCMSNYHFRDKSISLKSKGLLSLMLSLPDTWDYSVSGLAALSSDGETSVRTAVKELEEHNYLKRTPVRENGRIVDWEYDIYEKPLDLLHVENQQVETPLQEITDNKVSKQLNTKEVNKNNSKELLQNSPSFEFGKSKPKRESLFTQCVNLVDEFIDKHNCGNPVRQKLLSYLNYRLSVKEKPLYVNMWKGMLNKLDKLHQEGYGYEPVIDYCLERGYLSFYPPTGCYSDVKEKPWEKGVKSYTYTEEEKEELEKREQEMIARGERVWF